MAESPTPPSPPPAQLSFEAAFGLARDGVVLVKRDGRHAPFDHARVAGSIAKAAAECGETEPGWAGDLAHAVALYLKHGGTATVTTQAVSEAVEKVLLEMGHTRVAVAYARYRDQRARRRDLLAAGTPPPEPPRPDAPQVSVWRSDDQAVPWDRAQVAAILVREADLARDAAAAIAAEVEELILRGGFRQVTTALVRELAGARLIERGWHSAHTRHARLGVPLYDAEQLIALPGLDAPPLSASPRQSDHLLAERVKREFALTRVFSHGVAEAHLDGTLHLEGLGQVDRLHTLVLSPDWVARFGAPRPGHALPAAPPAYLEAFVVHLARTHALLSEYALKPVEWDALNLHVAPFVTGADGANMRRATQWILTEFAQGPPAILHLHWNVPAALAHTAPPQGGAFADHEDTARALLHALLEEALDGDTSGGAWRQPTFVVHVSQAMLASRAGRAALRLAARAAAEGSAMIFRFARGGDQLELGAPPWQPRRATAHALALNLPRAVYRVGGRMELLRDELERLATLAADAHAAKHNFLGNLITHADTGPLGLLARRHEGAPWFQPESAEYAVGLAGLAEGVHYLQQAGARGEPLDLAKDILMTLRESLAEHAAGTGLALRLDGTAVESTAAARLAALDLEAYPESTASTLAQGDATYDHNGRLHARAAINTPPDFALHPYYDRPPEGRIRIADDGAHGADGVAAWLQRLFSQTDCHRVRFEVR